MIEQISILLGRRVRLPGMDRIIRMAYPYGADSERYVSGVRSRNDGLRMEVDTRQAIDWTLLFHGEYEPHLRFLFESLLTPGAVAVDVGANVGAHTLTLARLVGPTGRVLAFEPYPDISEKLSRNVALNHFEQVKVFRFALGSTSEQLGLKIPTVSSAELTNPGMASLVALDTPHSVVEVEVKPLDSVWATLELQRLDLIKIDVQGYEQHTLLGMLQTLKSYRPILIFEYESWAWEEAGHTLANAFELLESLDYRFWLIGGQGRPHLRRVSDSTTLPEHCEILAMGSHDHRASLISRFQAGSDDGAADS